MTVGIQNKLEVVIKIILRESLRLMDLQLLPKLRIVQMGEAKGQLGVTEET